MFTILITCDSAWRELRELNGGAYGITYKRDKLSSAKIMYYSACHEHLRR